MSNNIPFTFSMFSHSIKVRGFISFEERLSMKKPMTVIFTYKAVDASTVVKKPAKVSYYRKNGVGLKELVYGNIKKLLEEKLLKDFNTCTCGRKHLNEDVCTICKCMKMI